MNLSWKELEDALGTEAWRVGVAATAVLLSLLAYSALYRAVSAWAARTASTLDDDIVRALRRPLSALFPLLALTAAWPQVSESDGMHPGRHAALVAAITCFGWLAIRVVRILDLVLAQRFQPGSDDLRARSVQTQLRGFRNIALFVIGLATIAAVLMTFDAVRQFGISLLASAGVAGVILGFAAQRSLATIVAGIQIALSQPIRVDDVVIVENEWGWIEEITLTYVVVKIWDERRLVLPINYFIERPFQNWTRNSTQILGTVFLYTDYRMPIDPLRAELQRLCQASSRWDGRVCELVVTDAKESVMELRALISAADSGKAWDLRCEIREGLLRYMQREHPEGLPRVRVEQTESIVRAALTAVSSRGGN